LAARLQSPGLDVLYQERVLPLKYRRVDLPGRLGRARIQKTLLGYEVQLGNVRKGCPDEVTARYLALFASLGLTEILIPYSPVDTAALLPDFERAFADTLAAARETARQVERPDLRRYYERRLCRMLADRIRTLHDLPENPSRLSPRPRG
jgi:hypothetical protein